METQISTFKQHFVDLVANEVLFKIVCLKDRQAMLDKVKKQANEMSNTTHFTETFKDVFNDKALLTKANMLLEVFNSRCKESQIYNGISGLKRFSELITSSSKNKIKEENQTKYINFFYSLVELFTKSKLSLMKTQLYTTGALTALNSIVRVEDVLDDTLYKEVISKSIDGIHEFLCDEEYLKVLELLEDDAHYNNSLSLYDNIVSWYCTDKKKFQRFVNFFEKCDAFISMDISRLCAFIQLENVRLATNKTISQEFLNDSIEAYNEKARYPISLSEYIKNLGWIINNIDNPGRILEIHSPQFINTMYQQYGYIEHSCESKYFTEFSEKIDGKLYTIHGDLDILIFDALHDTSFCKLPCNNQSRFMLKSYYNGFEFIHMLETTYPTDFREVDNNPLKPVELYNINIMSEEEYKAYSYVQEFIITYNTGLQVKK